jgi:hypothetical protein
MVLTVSFVLSPEIGLVVSVVRAMRSIIATASASRCQDHTTSPSASFALVVRKQRRPPLPNPTFVTIAKRPSLIGHGMRRIVLVICPTAQDVTVRPIGTTGKSASHAGSLSSDEQLLELPVMAGLDPAIHDFVHHGKGRHGSPGQAR